MLELKTQLDIVKYLLLVKNSPIGASKGRRTTLCKFVTPLISRKVKEIRHSNNVLARGTKQISARGRTGGTGPPNVNLGPL